MILKVRSAFLKGAKAAFGPSSAFGQSTFLESMKAASNPRSAFILPIVALFIYLADRSHADFRDTVFLASIAVLVFLLPAAGIVGPYLLTETMDAMSIIARSQDDSKKANAKSEVGASLKGILKSAEPLRRGFTYTLLAVLLSAIALVRTNKTVDSVLSAASLALLVGTAFAVFPITWRLLQLKQVQAVYEKLFGPDTVAPGGAAQSGPPPGVAGNNASDGTQQPSQPQERDAGPGRTE